MIEVLSGYEKLMVSCGDKPLLGIKRATLILYASRLVQVGKKKKVDMVVVVWKWRGDRAVYCAEHRIVRV